MAREVPGFDLIQARQAFEDAADELRDVQDQKIDLVSLYAGIANEDNFIERIKSKREYRIDNLNRLNWNQLTNGKTPNLDQTLNYDWPATVGREFKIRPQSFRKELAATFERISMSVEQRLQKDFDEGKPTRFKTLVVGGGPHASIYTSVNGPVMRDDMLVVFEQQVPGSIWNGSDWFLNSTAYNRVERPVTDVNLPLVGNSSPVIAWGERGVQISNLIDISDTYLVDCEDGSRSYPPGYAIGDAVQLNMLANVKNILGNTLVTIPADQKFEDGKPKKVWLSVGGKNVYQVEVDEIRIFRGSGQDRPAIDGSKKMEEFWKEQKVAWQERLSEFVSNPELQKSRIELPRLLTLNIITEARSYWRLYQNADPALDPFTPVRECDDLAVIGLNDGGRVSLEEIFYLTPDTRFSDLEKRVYPQAIDVYGKLPENIRTRYEKVARYTREICLNAGDRGVVVDVDDERENIVVKNEFGTTRDYDYVISQAGIEAPDDYSVFYPASKETVISNINDFSEFPNTSADFDSSLRVRTRRRIAPNVSYMGPSAGIKVQEFVQPINDLLRRLEIGENTLALWAVGWLTAWGAYTDAQEYFADKAEVRSVFNRNKFTIEPMELRNEPSFRKVSPSSIDRLFNFKRD